MAGIGIYVVEIGQLMWSRITRFVVVADDAQTATTYAQRVFATKLAPGYENVDPEVVNVSRIGNYVYEPSPSGAQFFGVIAEQLT